ncbi:MAG: glycosyltransferase family 39 protein [bacterium]|nr:glycosyltransferase family 39 protein [bacterium]
MDPAAKRYLPLLLTALALRAAVIFLVPDYQHPAAYEYGAIARNLAAGRGFSGGAWFVAEAPTAFMAPLYPALLALFQRFGFALPYLWLQLFQAAALTLAIIPFRRLARLCVGEEPAWTGAWLLAVYPMAVYSGKLVLSAPLAFALMTAALCFTVAAVERSRLAAATWAGVFWGLGLLQEPALVFLVPGLAAWALWRGWRGGAFHSVLARAGLAALVAGVIVGPWIVRNALVFHRFIFVKNATGLNFWQGNNPQATGALYTADGRSIMSALSAEDLKRLASMNEMAMNDWFMRRAGAFVREQPGRAARLYLVKLTNFYNPFPPRYAQYTGPGARGRFHAVRSACYALLFGASLAGLIVSWRRRMPVAPVLLAIIQPAVFYAFFTWIIIVIASPTSAC